MKNSVKRLNKKIVKEIREQEKEIEIDTERKSRRNAVRHSGDLNDTQKEDQFDLDAFIQEIDGEGDNEGWSLPDDQISKYIL